MSELLKGVPAQVGPDAKYSLGVIIRPTPQGINCGHSGYFPGYLTKMMYLPGHKFAVAVQVNATVGRAIGKPLRNFPVDFAETIVLAGN